MDLNNIIVSCLDIDDAYGVLDLLEVHTDVTWESGKTPIRGGDCAWFEERCIWSNDKIALFFTDNNISKIHIYYRNYNDFGPDYIGQLCRELKNPRVMKCNDFIAFLTNGDKIMPSNQDLMEFLKG